MVMGHYATALIPYAYNSQRKLAPFWMFLLAAQFLDFIMIAFVLMGIESLSPHQFFQASFLNMRVDMTFSHDLLPVLGWSVGLAIFAGIVCKNVLAAVWAFSLCILHELFDLAVGFKHYIFGSNTMAFGLNLYNTQPIIGIIIEALVCFGILTWYLKKRSDQGEPLSKNIKIGLYAILVGATVGLLPMANAPLSSFLG